MHTISSEMAGYVLQKIPKDNETIKDYLDIEKFLFYFNKISVYKRSAEECPFNRGNWMIDLFMAGGSSMPCVCFKIPIEMDEEKFLKWVKPLKDLYKCN